MNPRERVLTTLGLREPDKVPKIFGLSPALFEIFKEKTDSDDPADYFDFEIRGVGIKETKLQTDFTPYVGELPTVVGRAIFTGSSYETLAEPPRARVDEWGIGWVRGSLYHFEDMVHPLANLKEVEELEEYPFPDVTADYRWQNFVSDVKAWHDRNYAVSAGVPGVGGTLFETAWRLRGMENFLCDLLLHPNFAACLLDKLTEMAVINARRIAEGDADILSLADDVGTQRGMMMDPRTWRMWFKPRMREIIRAAKEVKPDIHVFYHSDGNVEPIIPDLIEIGIDILNPVQPECMDPVQIKKQYGERMAFWGTVGTQTTMPFGTPGEVKKVVRERIETVGKGGGLIIAPTHVLEPDVPWENVLAFVEAVDECHYWKIG